MRDKEHKGLEYFMTFINDYLRFRYVYLRTHKSEVLKKLNEFRRSVETQLGRPIKSLHIDKGGECFSSKISLRTMD